MTADIFCVLSFETSHQAIAAESAVTGLAGARLIPLPPEVSEGCGLALRVGRNDIDTAVDLLKKQGAVYQKAYELSIQGTQRSVRELSPEAHT